jgi:hypothetical protein
MMGESESSRAAVRNAVRAGRLQPGTVPRSTVRTTARGACDDCRAANAFHAWHDLEMTPSFNWELSFGDYGIPPAGKRAVIELVTAQILVPQGEWTRLRMFTSLGTQLSNLDLSSRFRGMCQVSPYTWPPIRSALTRTDPSSSTSTGTTRRPAALL